jgi:methionyl-tRNA formyltransferase
VRTVFLGSGPFGIEVLRRLARHPRIALVGVVSAPPRPVGRRAVVTPTPVHAAARELGLTVLTPDRLRAPEAVAEVLALEPAFAVLADYGQLVPPAILDLPHGALNLHPSLLPRHRGASPIPATILAGDRETGVTLMRMDEGLDTGPIVAVERVALDGSEAAPELEARLATVAAGLLERSLGAWLDGGLEAVPQSRAGATLTRPLRRADGRLDPGRPALELARQVRACRPWPGTFLDLPSGRIAVHAAHVEPSVRGDAVGRLVAHGDGLALATADGRLVLDELQPAGGRRMSGADLRRGRPALVGRE